MNSSADPTHSSHPKQIFPSHPWCLTRCRLGWRDVTCKQSAHKINKVVAANTTMNIADWPVDLVPGYVVEAWMKYIGHRPRFHDAYALLPSSVTMDHYYQVCKSTIDEQCCCSWCFPSKSGVQLNLGAATVRCVVYCSHPFASSAGVKPGRRSSVDDNTSSCSDLLIASEPSECLSLT